MQGAVNIGQNNKELVDHLIRLGYIRSKQVERVFRVIDRASYILKSHEGSAYKDIAWKNGNIHLSAPCIYSEVLETLALEPGLSFLNLGSGTGYLSTMAGLLLSSCGINHGVELHQDCLKYAYEKLEEFKQKSVAVDEFDFCEPVFVHGNCLNILPDRQYDRVYCGAACPEYYEEFLKKFVAIGGILVMPTKDHLLRLQRLNDDTWSVQTLMPVSFITLIIPSVTEHNIVRLPEYVPRTLQEICRDGIRRCLRSNILHGHSNSIATEVIIQSDSPKHCILNSSERFRGDLLIFPFDTNSDSISSDNGLESFQLLIPLFQMGTHYIVDPQHGRELEINNYSQNPLESCLENKSFNQFVEQKQASNMDVPVTIYGIHVVGENQQFVNNTNCQELNKYVAEKQSTDINIKSETQNEDITSENIHTQSNSETVTCFYVNGFYSNNLVKTIIQSKRCNNAKDRIRAIVKNTHYVNNKAFTAYMTEKILRLPLPYSLKTYINYNRQLQYSTIVVE